MGRGKKGKGEPAEVVAGAKKGKGVESDYYYESAETSEKLTGRSESVRDPYLEDDEDDLRIMGVRVTNLLRLARVVLAFPMVIVGSAINPSGRWGFMRNPWMVRLMNILIFVIPVLLVIFVLGEYDVYELHVGLIAVYIFTYLAPVAILVFSKMDVFSDSSAIEDGTFCFKPARSVRFNQANAWQLLGFIFEWVQHVLYVLPTGVITGTEQVKVEEYPPYLSFEIYFWIAVGATILCCLILVMNAVLRGKAHYNFQKRKWIWFILFNIGSPMYVTIVTILFMGLKCDYDVDPPVLTQDTSILCYGSQHTGMAQAALITLALYLMQHTLLPSGTFKETMGDDTLDIMFVPMYLSAHYLLKAIFCGVYVFFYEWDKLRIFILAIINFMLLWMNNYMKPCSISWVNTLRNVIFLHASFSGIMSVNYLYWTYSDDLKWMLISTLLCTIVFTSLGVILIYHYDSRSTEYSIATAFLDLEWQVSHGGTVHPRVLEPLISLTLSNTRADREIVKKYISQLIWLISYPNKRVQFQSAWALANLSLLEEDARLKVDKAEGTSTLLEWYMDMDDVVQLECLAALGNLSLSYDVVNAMVLKHKCVPFLLQLVSGNKLKHSQFALVAVANIARKERFRDVILRNGGVASLIGAIMSHDRLKLKFSAVAMGNLVLSHSTDMLEALRGKGVLDRILKMTGRNEADTQRELVALLRNLTCYATMREFLFKKGVIKVMERVRHSSYENVSEWVHEVLAVMTTYTQQRLDHKKRQELSNDLTSDDDMLATMRPLTCQIEWSTWGSKLDAVFSPIFENTSLSVSPQHVFIVAGTAHSIDLSVGVPAGTMAKWKETADFEIEERPKSGTVTVPNNRHRVTYTPKRGFRGEDSFSFMINIGHDFKIGSITITVAADRTPRSSSFMQKVKAGSSFDDDEEDDDDDEEAKINNEEVAKVDPDDFDIEVGLDRSDRDKDEHFVMESPVARQRKGKTQDEDKKISLRGISRMKDGAFADSLGGRESYFGDITATKNKEPDSSPEKDKSKSKKKKKKKNKQQSAEI